MKIKSLNLRNYKRFINEQTISFCNQQGEANDIVLLVGENGSGKTSILQAITAVIGATNRPKMRIDKLDWEGYDYPSLQSGSMPIKIELKVEFNDQELYNTKLYAQELQELGRKIPHLPNEHNVVDLSLNYNERRVNARQSAGDYFQFSGYQYALQLKQYKDDYLTMFDKIGSIYWYNEQRTSHSIKNPDYTAKNIDNLRDILVKMSYFHIHRIQTGNPLRLGQRDSFEKLNDLYRKIFPTRQLVGAEPNRYDINKSDFMLKDGDNDYELSGLSAGERAIFPILLDFSLLNINNSIIIIDEIELHLNPKLLRSFLNTIQSLGKNNQFILTSHSSYVMRELPKENILIVKDGLVQPIDVFTKGRDASTIIEELFEIPRRTPEALQIIKEFYKAIENQELELAKVILGEMGDSWGNLDEDVIRAQMYYEDMLNDIEYEAHP